MRVRFAACRPGYHFELKDHAWEVVCINGSRISQRDSSHPVALEATALTIYLPASHS